MINDHVAHDLYATLIDQLVKRRRELNLSQHSLDDKIGCAEGLVAKWESGARMPRPRSLAEWAIALGGSIYFFPGPPADRDTDV